MKQIHRCTACGKEGHSVRTCAVPMTTEQIAARMQERKREYDKRAYKRSKEVGVCTKCDAPAVGSRCVKCRATETARRIETREGCAACGKKGHNSRTCDKRVTAEMLEAFDARKWKQGRQTGAPEYYRARGALRYYRLRRAGLCVRCGFTPVQRFVICLGCRQRLDKNKKKEAA